MPVAQRLDVLVKKFREIEPPDTRLWTNDERRQLFERMQALRQTIAGDAALKAEYIRQLRNSTVTNRNGISAFDLDYSFLEESEGARVPFGYKVLSGGQPLESSGVTTATGFDIGTKSIADMEKAGLPGLLITTLSPYAASGPPKISKNARGRIITVPRYFRGVDGAYLFLDTHPLGAGTISQGPFRYTVTNYANSLMPAEITALDAASLKDRAIAAQ
jgi:hypothetical protein